MGLLLGPVFMENPIWLHMAASGNRGVLLKGGLGLLQKGIGVDRRVVMIIRATWLFP